MHLPRRISRERRTRFPTASCIWRWITASAPARFAIPNHKNSRLGRAKCLQGGIVRNTNFRLKVDRVKFCHCEAACGCGNLMQAFCFWRLPRRFAPRNDITVDFLLKISIKFRFAHKNGGTRRVPPSLSKNFIFDRLTEFKKSSRRANRARRRTMVR